MIWFGVRCGKRFVVGDAVIPNIPFIRVKRISKFSKANIEQGISNNEVQIQYQFALKLHSGQ